MSSDVYLNKAVLQISPFDPALDELSMIDNDYNFNIVGRFDSSAGTLTITNPGTPALTADDWDRVINFPAYRLNIDVSFSGFLDYHFSDEALVANIETQTPLLSSIRSWSISTYIYFIC